ncbi:hypothetical protein EYF80_029672 [Liparis tanakae]|uniref:Uncharacterized protein n=1 Tax=Liparis tanakae TaxID=230148 RepID=A0A4Z2H3T2_9TELE|nr:hypothetical protein EYF80_029672 [Liparis tanakae]
MERYRHEKHRLPHGPVSRQRAPTSFSQMFIVLGSKVKNASLQKSPALGQRYESRLDKNAHSVSRFSKPPKTTTDGGQMGACDENLVGPEDPRRDEPRRRSTVGVDVLVISGWHQVTPDDVSASTAT